jgi:predicted DNA-binding antitoxin AbrB/MazE fold protein
MEQVITAVYENGVLRPLKPLNLPEHKTVNIQILPDQVIEQFEAALQLLAEEGVVSLPDSTAIQPMSTEERLKLTQYLAKVGNVSLSEKVIAERNELPW